MIERIIYPAIERYLHEATPASPPVLRKLEARAAKEVFPVVGPLVGRLLALLAGAIQARTVFELGSGFGYSALWFASALPSDGRVVLTDTSAAHLKQAQGYFEEAGETSKAEFQRGDALELVRAYPGPCDIIFIDMDKARYPAALAAALPKLRSGGLLIADNVLWSGRVAQPRPDADTAGLQEFTRALYAARELATTMLPLRDGVAVSLKL